MKSRITIDLDRDNHPIIKINYQPSEDVRDKMVKRFMESFGGDSYFATFFYYNNSYMEPNSEAHIRPIAPKDLQYHIDGMRAIVERETQEPESKSLTENAAV